MSEKTEGVWPRPTDATAVKAHLDSLVKNAPNYVAKLRQNDPVRAQQLEFGDWNESFARREHATRQRLEDNDLDRGPSRDQ